MGIKIKLVSDNKGTRFMINGRKMSIEREGRSCKLLGIKTPEIDNTVGGLIAREIHELADKIDRVAFELNGCGDDLFTSIDDEVLDDMEEILR